MARQKKTQKKAAPKKKPIPIQKVRKKERAPDAPDIDPDNHPLAYLWYPENANLLKFLVREFRKDFGPSKRRHAA